jgi:hypothetical protein
MMTVRVTITDSAITMKPNVAERGSNAIFVITNQGKRTHTLQLGDVVRGVGKKIGFASGPLAPNQQKTVVMFLDYRGVLPFTSAHTSDKGKVGMKGIFRIR